MTHGLSRILTPARALLLAAGLLLGGCTVGPNFQRPAVKTPRSWLGAAVTTATAARAAVPTSATVNLAVWWRAFNDPILNGLIDRAMSSNLDVQAAIQRVRQARAQLGESVSGLYPSANANANYARSYSSVPKPKPLVGPRIGGDRIYSNSNRYQAGFDAGWELDIFGGVRRQIEAQDANFRSAKLNLSDLLVTLTAEVGTNYLQLRTLQDQLRITHENLKDEEHSADITRKKKLVGFVSNLDVVNAEAQVASTKAGIPSLEASIAQSIYQLSVLLGEPPEALLAELSPAKPLPTLPAPVAAGVPSELLERRPDIRSAEEQVHAATAQIGVATANLFPSFSLNGSLSFSASRLASWDQTVSRLISFGPSMSYNLFDAFRTRWSIDAAKAAREQTILQYRKIVLTAIQDVESAWIDYENELERGKSLEQAVELNRRALDLSTKLYAAGQTDFLTVLVAERSVYGSEQSLAQSRSNAAVSLVALYKALGGGWRPEEFESQRASYKLQKPREE